MSKLFMYGTSLQETEKLMLMVPNFQPRRSGIVINNYFNCQGGDVDCKFNIIKADDECRSCGNKDLNFKLNVDKQVYKNLVMECFGRINNKFLKDRLKELSRNFKGEIFLNIYDKERFYNHFQNLELNVYDLPSRFVAIIFLLTADENLWRISKDLIKANRFDLKKIYLRDIDTG